MSKVDNEKYIWVGQAKALL